MLTITIVTLLVSSIGLNVWLALRCAWLYDSWEAERKHICKSCWLLFDYRSKSDELRKSWECIAELKERNGARYSPTLFDGVTHDPGPHAGMIEDANGEWVKR